MTSTETFSTTATNYLLAVAEKTRASFDLLCAAWSSTRSDLPDGDRALQLQRWASPDPWLGNRRDTPNWRLASCAWRAQDPYVRQEAPRIVRFTQCPRQPTPLFREETGEFVRATWEPTGVELLRAGVPAVLEHDQSHPLGTVDAVVPDGLDCHTVITFDRGAEQDDLLAAIALGEDIGISWSVSADWSQAQRDGDRAHHDRSVIHHVGVTRSPRIPSIRPPVLIPAKQAEQLRAQSVPVLGQPRTAPAATFSHADSGGVPDYDPRIPGLQPHNRTISDPKGQPLLVRSWPGVSTVKRMIR